MSLTSSLMFPISTVLLVFTEFCWFAVHWDSQIFSRGFKITGIALGGAKNRVACGSHRHTFGAFHFQQEVQASSFTFVPTYLERFIRHYHSPAVLWACVIQALLCRMSEGFFLKSHPAHGWRWGLPDSWQEHCHLLLIMKSGWKITSSFIWPGLKGSVSQLLALVGGIFTYRMPFL